MTFNITKFSIIYLFLALLSFGCGAQKGNVSDFTLIGERHGIAQQQQQIAKQLESLVSPNKKTAVIMEMISQDQAELVSTFRKLYPDDPKDFGYAIGWDKTTWPDYEGYAPIIDVIWSNDIHLSHGDASQATRERWRKGQWTLEEIADTVPEHIDGGHMVAVQTAWEVSVQEAHCGQLTDNEMRILARVQMLRDAYMAKQMMMLKEQGYDTIILIAGRSHTRKDRGVPLYLKPDSRVHSVALIETDPNKSDGETYQPKSVYGDISPYDEVIMTSAIEVVESACERLRRKGLIE